MMLRQISEYQQNKILFFRHYAEKEDLFSYRYHITLQRTVAADTSVLSFPEAMKIAVCINRYYFITFAQ